MYFVKRWEHSCHHVLINVCIRQAALPVACWTPSSDKSQTVTDRRIADPRPPTAYTGLQFRGFPGLAGLRFFAHNAGPHLPYQSVITSVPWLAGFWISLCAELCKQNTPAPAPPHDRLAGRYKPNTLRVGGPGLYVSKCSRGPQICNRARIC